MTDGRTDASGVSFMGVALPLLIVYLLHQRYGHVVLWKSKAIEREITYSKWALSRLLFYFLWVVLYIFGDYTRLDLKDILITIVIWSALTYGIIRDLKKLNFHSKKVEIGVDDLTSKVYS